MTVRDHVNGMMRMSEYRDCMNCTRYYPGTGCQSQQELACGCCPSPISPSDRIAQLTNVVKDVVTMLTHVKIEVAKQEMKIDNDERRKV